ncbi:hypothetical protein GLW04_19340 [Halobacillus litoralis]|uniref:Uncharacterized protein n=1 Tax=Halobacillus litoralis TaxID=45668 RepID=A0A845E0F1_9BACI|nr:hypothetical protein [Halobacillus litoralis]MYL22032.1 hypothetical protein [Halobacillus litoralis]
MSGVEVRERKKRKTRSDKKREIKPTVNTELKNCVYRLSFVTDTPVKDVIEILCMKGLNNRIVIEHLSQYFRRDYQFKSTFYIGSLENESLQSKIQPGKSERITTRFSQEDYERIYLLSIALDVTPSKATALLLDASIRNSNLLNSFVKTYLHTQLDKQQMKDLKHVLKYINKNNPYNEEVSWFTLVSMIVDDLKENTSNVKQRISKWIERNK